MIYKCTDGNCEIEIEAESPDEAAQEYFTCTLCGQRIDDGEPCGCGKRPSPRSVSIPVKKLKEWRRGLMTIDGEELTLFMIDHAREIKAEIEAYINATT